MVDRHVQLGAQIYINRDDTPEMVASWVRQMAESGLKMARAFIFWYQVEPDDGVWDFANYDALFQEAEKLGVSVCATLMAVYPPGWMHLTDNYKVVGDLDDEVFWNRALQYVAKVVGRYHKSPALHSWVTWKEPARFISRNPKAMKAFRRYLRDVYGDINALNSIYYNRYTSFDVVGEHRPSFAILNYQLYPESLDWTRFAVVNLCNKLRDLAAAVKKIDKVHPIHVNAHNVGGNQLNSGASIWNEAKAVDFLGCSNHPSWHALRFPEERWHQSVAYFADMIKSATPDPDGYFWITELQGGPTTLSGGKYMVPSIEDIEHWLWECVGTGAAAVVFWVLNIRNSGDEAGEWSLLGQDGRPSRRLDAVSRAAKLIADHQAIFDAARPKKPDVWLLCSENSWQLADVEGDDDRADNPRNKQYAPDALCAAYLMTSDLGLQAHIINEEKFLQGELPPDAVLLAPSVFSVEDGFYAALERFVQGGGTLIADYMLAFKDKYGRVPKPENGKAVLDRIFGAELTDLLPRRDFFPLPCSEYCPEGWFLELPMREAGCEVLARFEDGQAAVVRNFHGSGCAIRIGTVFFQQYLSRPKEKNLSFLRSLLPDRIFTGIRLNNPRMDLRLKLLETVNQTLLVLLNKGAAREAELILEREGTLTNLRDGKQTSALAGISKIALERGEVMLLLYRKGLERRDKNGAETACRTGRTVLC